MEQELKQVPAALLLMCTLLLLGLGIYFVLLPHGQFTFTLANTPIHIDPMSENGRTVTVVYPHPILLGTPGPQSKYVVTFSNPLISEYSNYRANDKQPYTPTLYVRDVGTTKVTISDHHTKITMTLIVRNFQ